MKDFIKSGEKAKCKCGYNGRVYGTFIAGTVSAPWCPKCERNNNLTKQ